MLTQKGHSTGQKKPFKLEDIWRIRTRLEIEGNIKELALLNLAIDCKLRSCDLLRMKVRDKAVVVLFIHALFTGRVKLTEMFNLKSRLELLNLCLNGSVKGYLLQRIIYSQVRERAAIQ